VAGEPAVRAENLTKRFRGPDGQFRTVVSDVSFSLSAGKTLGIVGESGSGKTTSARLLLGVETPDEGRVLVHGVPWQEMSSRQRRRERRYVQAIYQDPLGSFDPRYTVKRVLLEALGAAGHTGAPARRRAVELLGRVRLEASYLDRRPALLSGGQRQRVAIARALAADPEVIVCDEPVSALDVSVQAQILDLLLDLQSELGIAYLFISHDLGVVNHVADDVLVMKDAVVVESGPVEEIFDHPRADYTRSLLSAVPRLTSVPTADSLTDDAVGATR
jgi:peptide/nickel transport system ATP-binding protein